MTLGGRIAFDEMVRFDRRHRAQPASRVAGVDEAGRGALAGPVVAAAVICEPCDELAGVRDSKLVTERERERLYDLILEHSAAWSVGMADPAEIDRINILRATLKAMKAAVEALRPEPEIVLVDGRHVPDLELPSKAVPGGDRRSFAIAAASILAKVTRDRIMREKARLFDGYGFTRNKGYGTREHIEAIRRSGRTELHRASFRVREQLRMELGGGAPGKG